MIRCSLKGKLKLDHKLKKDKLYKTDIAVAGDYVDFELNQDGSGIISKIDERKNYLSRKAPKVKGASYRGERLEQVTAANIDNLVIVSSVFDPLFNNKVIDRFLVTAESSAILPIIIINKIDLDEDNFAEEWYQLYTSLGYKVFLTSAKDDKNFDELKKFLHNKKSLFWGQSGVGKSTILNKIYNLSFNTGVISSFNNKGKHTTVTSIMINVDDSTFIIDTPGIREIDPFGIRKENLGYYFIEFKNFIKDCKFSTCTHQHEPGCAVIKAVEDELISPYRYDSYLRILDTIEEDIIF